MSALIAILLLELEGVAAPDGVSQFVDEATPMTVAVQREMRTIPIVFEGVGDPVASGIVSRLDRPSGNEPGSGAVYVWPAIARQCALCGLVH
jgi:ABC-type uncharacterized transport system substrate-binding protein